MVDFVADVEEWKSEDEINGDWVGDPEEHRDNANKRVKEQKSNKMG